MTGLFRCFILIVMTQVHTIGHSTHALAEFIEILQTYDISALVDVRTLPGSRRWPHFNQENLAKSLPAAGIKYQYIKKLGGLRSPNKQSLNAGWHNSSFRGYADYMQTDGFLAGLEELLQVVAEQSVCIMCAEVLPWRCHRRMIGDALLVRGYEVIDIFSLTKAVPEKLTDFAQVQGEKITYPELETA